MSIRNCVLQALNQQQIVIDLLRLTTEIDLDEIPVESASPAARAVIDAFIKRLIESVHPGTSVSVSLIDGNHQWELEVAGHFKEMEQVDPSSFDRPRLFDAQREPVNQDLQSLAIECGGAVERWNCPQGGSALVLVMLKSQLGRNSA
jgi:hypothetical protein